ncbi:MAG: nitroreductase family protein [Planctomycetota bacterium]
MNVLEAIRMRRSVRAYASKPIPPDVLDRLRQALRFAPSACNLQPWRFIFVFDPQIRQRLAQAAQEQLFIADAPLIVAGCGLPQQAYKAMGGSGNSADIDVTIALDHLTLAAVAEGLGTCWIGAFDESETKRVLCVPRQAKVVALMPVGYPATAELISAVDNSQRKTGSEVFAIDRFA